MITSDERPILVKRKVFLARLARRLAASVFAMGVLNFLSPSGPHKEPVDTFVRLLPSALATAAGEPTLVPSAPVTTVLQGEKLVQIETGSSPGRTHRLYRSVHQGKSQQVLNTKTSRALPASIASVTLFDACRPACESRDPLLHTRQIAVTKKSTDVTDDKAPAAILASLEAEEQTIPSEGQSEGIVRSVYTDVGSLTRRGLGVIDSGFDLLKGQ